MFVCYVNKISKKSFLQLVLLKQEFHQTFGAHNILTTTNMKLIAYRHGKTTITDMEQENGSKERILVEKNEQNISP